MLGGNKNHNGDDALCQPLACSGYKTDQPVKPAHSKPRLQVTYGLVCCGFRTANPRHGGSGGFCDNGGVLPSWLAARRCVAVVPSCRLAADPARQQGLGFPGFLSRNRRRPSSSRLRRRASLHMGGVGKSQMRRSGLKHHRWTSPTRNASRGAPRRAAASPPRRPPSL